MSTFLLSYFSTFSQSDDNFLLQILCNFYIKSHYYQEFFVSLQNKNKKNINGSIR